MEYLIENRLMTGFVSDILSYGLSDIFLRGCFVHDGAYTTAVYDTSDLISLADMRDLKMSEGGEAIKKIMSAIVRGIARNEKIYVFPGEYELSLGTVYRGPGNLVRIAYVPCSAHKSELIWLVDFVKEMEAICNEEGKDTVDSIVRFIENNPGSRRKLLKYLES